MAAKVDELDGWFSDYLRLTNQSSHLSPNVRAVLMQTAWRKRYPASSDPESGNGKDRKDEGGGHTSR